jgi:putative ABC transport system permease protein
MKAILLMIRADIRSRPIQTAVILLLTLLAGAMASGSLTVITKSNDSFDLAFERLTGPHLTFGWDSERVDPAQLMATGHLPGITATGSVHPTALLPVEVGSDRFVLEFVGRDSAEEAVDRYQLLAGRWPEQPGEIAVTRLERADYSLRAAAIGDQINVLSRADRPSFVVVGVAFGMSQLSNHARAFVRSDQIAPLTDRGAYRMGYELAYRVERPDTEASLAGYATAIRAALPRGAETVPLSTSQAERRDQAWMSGFAAPQLFFALLALVAAAFIVGNVITGMVLASQRELGIMQAVGFSRRQVVLVVAGQAMLPAVAGAAIGIPIGLLGSAGTLSSAAENLVVEAPNPVSLELDLAILAGIVLVVGVAAALAARRAGNADAARVISLGMAPSVTSDGFLARTLRSLPLPRPVRLGVGDTFLRPIGGLITITVLVLGVAAMTFAIGIQGLVGTMSENKATSAANYGLTVDRFGPLSDERVNAILGADPGVAAAVGIRETVMTIDGLATPVRATAMRGETAALDYRASVGRWFEGPGEAVMSALSMREAGVRIGDFVTGLVDGRPIRLRVVGEFDDFSRYDFRGIRFDWASYQELFPGEAPRLYLVGLRPSANPTVVASRLEQADPHFLRAGVNQKVWEVARIGSLMATFLGLPAFLLLLIGGIAVFNTILLNTTARGFDHAVLKAIGMSPRQVIAMAVSPAVAIGLLGTIVGIPLGAWLLRWLLRVMGGDAIDLDLPVLARGLDLPAFVAVGAFAMAAALLGARLPAIWAAHRSVADALRAE